jgi:hypothetical protein
VRLLAANGHKLSPIVSALLVSLAGCNSANNRVVEETFERLYAGEPSTNVTIQNGDGAVLLYGSNVNEIRVHAVKKAYSRARLAQIAVNVLVGPGSVSITTKFPPKPEWGLFDRSGTVDYTIVIPATASISGLNLDAGEILLDGMRGPAAHARLGEGRIFARNCFTNLDLAMRRGNVIMSFDWWEDSRFSAQASIAHGNAWAYLPSDAAFHLLANAAYGKIFNDFETVPVAAPPTVGGMKTNLAVHRGGEGTINIQVAEGNIKIVEANP